jgi:carboxylate-amine ligase
MDAQSRGDESTAIAALSAACVAQAALDYDAGIAPDAVPARMIEENTWRAIRHGLDGELIDFSTGTEVPARGAVEAILDWTAPARAELRLDDHLEGLTAALDGGNGAQRQWRRHEAGESMRDIYAASVEETAATYAAPRACVGADSKQVTT